MKDHENKFIVILIEMGRMKAAIWHGKRDVRVEEIQVPGKPAKNQVKIEVSWCGICGTDLHEYMGGPIYIPEAGPHPLTGVKAPVTLGHEIAGKVIEAGSDVTRVKVGDRVALCPIIGCLECRWCKSGLMGICDNVAFLGISWTSGAFSQFINVYDYMCYQLPEEVSDEIGAMVEPFSATVRAIQQVNVQPGDNVAIVGCGPIGLMAIQAARITGAGQIFAVEPATRRQELALECGATTVVNPLTEDVVSAIKELTNGDGADIVVECAGVSVTGQLAGQIARRKGRIMIMGVFEKPAALDYTDVVFSEKTIMGSMGGYGVYEEAIGMMARKEFNGTPLITGKIPLERIVSDGFEALINQKESNVKILVSPI